MAFCAAGCCCRQKVCRDNQSSYFREKYCLQALGIQACIVHYEMAGCLQDTSYPGIVTDFAGKPVSKLSRAQQCTYTANEALSSLHAVGACHRDIRLPRDLAHCVMNSSQDQQHDEKL